MNAEYDYEDKFQEALKSITSNSLKHKLVAIKNLVAKRLALERQFKAEHNKLEAKYEALYKPIYEKRREVINGETQPNMDEIKDQLESLSLNSDVPSTENGVPEFWLKCIKNFSQLASLVNENDEKVLKFLTDIYCETKEDGSFCLFFSFAQNPYFDHPVLKREFILDDKLNIKKIESTQIAWKSEDLNPTVQKKKKKIKNKKTKETKTVTKLEEVPSVFNFFKSFDEISKEKKKTEDKDDDDDAEESPEDLMEDEYDLGLDVKEDLIPYAIEYYLGILKDDEEDDEEEGEEDAEEEEEEPAHKHHKKGGKGKLF